MQYLVVTGLSGAGKTLCTRYLEDFGCFCMDNMPPMLVPKIIEDCETGLLRKQAAVFSMDVRSGEFFDPKAVADMIRELRKRGRPISVLFIEASDETLISRYKESRRDHPLMYVKTQTLADTIANERAYLQPLRETAEYVLDTTGTTASMLKEKMRTLLPSLLGHAGGEAPLRVEILSFGYKRGLPRDADIVLDVRFLPNPFYVESLCRHCGLDDDVREYVMNNPVTAEFMRKLKEMIEFLLPHYRNEGKHRLVIAVGCTGGAHRSVAIAEETGTYLKAIGVPVDILHRDLQLEQARWKPQQGEKT